MIHDKETLAPGALRATLIAAGVLAPNPHPGVFRLIPVRFVVGLPLDERGRAAAARHVRRGLDHEAQMRERREQRRQGHND